ncbi:hypothetical protein SAMN05192558_107152 [Actinokineospora alba]|uniref:Lipoprotein n=1 Tax=Actinokineospora alba TaxID=504798 RepID=A0A1H0QUG6_9PSEU|nr:hypothetical protein [Actinokineospora alba]TDP70389.1 hypothetical protein C8E96_5999 [Actinokineospora alba]SDI32751.1 hypothetical protein SAMN05421871_104151 [Actinokineospora alba]SDP20924.1 hypothetical protein SAMN05192558_107152 [Actinokineospora alba]
MGFPRSVLSLAVIASTVLVAGCQSGGDTGTGATPEQRADQSTGKPAEPAEPAADIEVVETGAATGRMFAVVRNNESRVVVARLEFHPVDAAGAPVSAIGDSAVVVLPASSTIPVAMDLGSKVPAKVTVDLKPTDAKVKPAGDGDFADKSATLTGDGTRTPWQVKTSFTNGYAEAIENHFSVLICRDAASKVVAAVTWGFSAAPGETVTKDHDFQYGVMEIKGTPTKCEVFPRLAADFE